MFILAADKRITNSDIIIDTFEMTPAFSGISGAIVDFVIPAPAAANTHPVDFAVDTSIVDSLEIENLLPIH